MKIEDEGLYFIVHFSEKEKLTGVTEVLEERLSSFVYTSSEDKSEFHILTSERDKFNRILNKKFQHKQLSLF